MDLPVNENKTNKIFVGPKKIPRDNVNVQGYSFEMVKSFNYPGTELPNQNKVVFEMNIIIMAENSACFHHSYVKEKKTFKVYQTKLMETWARALCGYLFPFNNFGKDDIKGNIRSYYIGGR